MFKNKWSWLLPALIIFFQSAAAQHFKIDFEPASSSTDWNGYTVVQRPDGNHAALVEEKSTYACNLHQPISEILFGKNLKINIKASFIPDSIPTGAVFVVSLTRADTLVFYHGIILDGNHSNEPNWTLAESSFLFPSDLNQNLSIKAYIWNKAKTNFYVDNLQIDVEEAEIPSYLPPLSASEINEKGDFLFENDFFKIAYHPTKQHLTITDGDGEALTKPFQLLIASRSKVYLNNDINQHWRFEKKVRNKNITILHFASKMAHSTTKLLVHCSAEDSKVHFEIVTKFRKKTIVERTGIVIPFLEPVEQVFRKNALMDTCCFQTEYYLGHGGVKIGNGARSVLLINSLQLSSTQLQNPSSLLYLNTDLASDHPMIHYPLAEDSSDYFEDLSAIEYKKGASIRGSVSLFVATDNKIIPRISDIPDGFDAAMAWTEHADWTDASTQRAVNFGEEKIELASEAKGGFVRYNIPVTKSIFFNNPDKVSNLEASDGLFPRQHASLKDDTTFAKLISQLKEAGHEICLHTPEQYTSTTKNLKNALLEMHVNFGSPTWIDHGYNNKSINNRENLVCDGNKKGSKMYAKKMWEAFGVRYFWNPWWEEANPFRPFAFNGHFSLPYPGFGDAFPVAMIHKFPGMDKAFLWGTTGTLEAPNDALWNYFFQPYRLQALLDHRSIHITHVYPAWVKEGKGFWRFNENGQCVATDGFNQALSAINNLHDAHKLLPATISYLVNYIEALEYIHIEPIENNSFLISNTGTRAIKGLSFLAKANRLTINGEKTEHTRQVLEDLIFWFDIEAGENVLITLQ